MRDIQDYDRIISYAVLAPSLLTEQRSTSIHFDAMAEFYRSTGVKGDIAYDR